MSKLVQLVSDAINAKCPIPAASRDSVSRAAIETVIAQYVLVAEESLMTPVKKGRGAFAEGYEEGYTDALTFDAVMILRQMLEEGA